jgi:hypothetical protein
MKVKLGKASNWWKSALAGLILPILLTLAYPLIIIGVFIVGMLGFINISKAEKEANTPGIKNNDAINSEEEKVSFQEKKRTILEVMDKYKEIVKEMKKPEEKS